jgi:hypothetical protein
MTSRWRRGIPSALRRRELNRRGSPLHPTGVYKIALDLVFHHASAVGE